MKYYEVKSGLTYTAMEADSIFGSNLTSEVINGNVIVITDRYHVMYGNENRRILLVRGNNKIGKSVWHWSMTPGSCGTCFGTCEGCYGLRGRYTYANVKEALAKRTEIAKNSLNWFTAEVIREIHTLKIKYVRIHVTGDFFSGDYVKAWIEIVNSCPDTTFWTYTKSYGHGFDLDLIKLSSLPNCNIVRSKIPCCGYNYGHADYILDTYYKLLSEGKNPYICPCGCDDSVHCSDCRQCAKSEYVLFLEHSTDYVAKKDPRYNEVVAIVINQ